MISIRNIRSKEKTSKMIAKVVAFLCIFGIANAGYINSGLGYSSLGYSGIGYSGVAPVYSSYSAPIVTKTVVPAVSYAPAISPVSSYAVHSPISVHAPIVRSYSSPISYGGLYRGW